MMTIDASTELFTIISTRNNQFEEDCLSSLIGFCRASVETIRELHYIDPRFGFNRFTTGFEIGIGSFIEIVFQYRDRGCLAEDTRKFSTEREVAREVNCTPLIDFSLVRFPSVMLFGSHITGYNRSKPSRPTACEGCSSYHGQSYGGNMLVCGIHASGWDGDECPDWSE